MDKLDLSKKRVMHIDTSGKLYERKDTGIAYKIINRGEHKGLVLSIKSKKGLRKNLKIHKDFPRMYAICIYYLIKDNLDDFDILVICADENFSHVKRYLDLLFKDENKYSKKDIISIYQLRKISGNKSLKSYADGIANSYRRRGLKSISKKQEGIPLNVFDINYIKIKDKWLEINEKLKNK